MGCAVLRCSRLQRWPSGVSSRRPLPAGRAGAALPLRDYDNGGTNWSASQRSRTLERTMETSEYVIRIYLVWTSFFQAAGGRRMGRTNCFGFENSPLPT